MHAFATQGHVPAARHLRYLALLSVVIAVTVCTLVLLWASAGDIAHTPTRHPESTAPSATTQVDAAGTSWWQSPPQPTPPGGNPFIGRGPIGH